MGRLEEQLGGAAISRFDLVVEKKRNQKSSSNPQENELSLQKWYNSCQSAPGSQSYDFFCRQWPDIPVSTSVGLTDSDCSTEQESPGSHGPGNERVSESQEAHGDGSSHTSLSSTSDKALLLSVASHDVTRFVTPTYVSKHVREAWHDETYFTAGHAPVQSVEDGVRGPVQLSIDRSEDGLYCGIRPHVSSYNLARMANRLTVHRNWGWDETEGGGGVLRDAPLEPPMYRRHPHREVLLHPYSEGEDELPPLTRFVEAGCDACPPPSVSSTAMTLKLGTLAYRHHSLMAPEHVLVHRLVRAVRQYSARQRSESTRLLQHKMQVLRNAMARLQQMYPDMSSDHQSSTSEGPMVGRVSSVIGEVDYTRRLQLYRDSIHTTREEMHTSARLDRQWLTEALATWSQIKELRETQEYAVTPVTMVIRKEQVGSEESEQTAVMENVECEVVEREGEEQRKYALVTAQNHKEMQHWKLQHKARKSAVRRMRTWRDAGCRGDESATLQAARDELALAAAEKPRPQPPDKPRTAQQLRSLVTSLYASHHRAPGEPLLQLTLEGGQSVTPTHQRPLQERRRQQALLKTRVSVRVLINQKVVTQSPWCAVDETAVSSPLEFPVTAVVSSPAPHTVTLQLLQRSTTGAAASSLLHTPATTVATTALPLVPLQGCEWLDQEIRFTADKVVCHSHAGVGSGTGAQGEQPPTNALLDYSLTTHNQQGAAIPQTQSSNLLIQRDNVGHTDPNMGHLDPNDPRNAKLATAAAKSVRTDANIEKSLSSLDLPTNSSNPDEGDSSQDQFFECDGESVSPTWLCSKQELDSNLRLKMLHLRDAKVPEFQGLHRIPALTSQILRSTVWDYEAKQASSSTLQDDSHDVSAYNLADGGDVDDDDWLDDVADRLADAERLVASVRRRLLQQTAVAAAVPTPEDMVQEEQIPDIGTLGTSLVSVLRPKRPLKPARRVRGAVRGQGLTGRQVRLICTVARAFNVPVRTSGEGHGGLAGSVRPFVSLSFQGRQTRTSVACGTNPTWNQQLVLPFRAPNDDYSCVSLGLVRENIVLQLFDERILELNQFTNSNIDITNTQHDTQLHTQLHNTWLASLTIPATAMLHSSKIEGTFEVSSPVCVLGYGNEGGNHTNTSTHLTLYITLEPTLPQPQLIKGLHPCPEPAQVVAASTAWQESLTSRYPTRIYGSHVINMAGQLIALDRWCRPLEPPPQLVQADSSAHSTLCRVAWWVSLLPALPDMTLLPGTPPITATAQQLVGQHCGGEAERAMLLTNYCLHLGYTAYLLMGSSVCQGHYSCVLVQSGTAGVPGAGGVYSIWCPGSAKCHSTRDPFCPVKAVYMLVSPENVWGNCQRWEDPARVNFTVTDSTCWRPLYTKGCPQPGLPSSQSPQLQYSPPCPHHERPLRDHLLTVVRAAFMSWRPHHRTIWNRHASDVLRHAVRRLEGARAAGGAAPGPSTQLTRLHVGHSVCGVCVQQGWRGVGPLLAAVHSSGVHTCTLPGVEFALAVHTHTYTANVTSVWLYIASLVRNTP